MGRDDFRQARSALNPRQRRLLDLVLSGTQPTDQAAVLAAGYSERTVPANILAHSGLQEAIRLGQLDAAEAGKSVMTAAKVLDDLVELAESNPVDGMDENGRMMAPEHWPVGLQRRIKKITVNAIGQVEDVTLDSVIPIYGMIGKHRAVAAFAEVEVKEQVLKLVDYTRATGGRTNDDEGEGNGPVIDIHTIGAGDERRGSSGDGAGEDSSRADDGDPAAQPGPEADAADVPIRVEPGASGASSGPLARPDW